MEIKKVAVIGAGTMGSSIAMAFITSNFPVLLYDVDDKFINSGLSRIDKFLESQIKKGLNRQEAEARKGLIKTTCDFKSFNDIDLVIEAAPENIEVKKQIFEHLDKYCPAHTILATNTSSLSITQIAGFTNRPYKVIGAHFFNPAHLMKLVEIIPGLDTSNETVVLTQGIARKLGKLAIRVEECASFLVNRLLGRYMNESLFCLQEGLASAVEIDNAVCDYLMPIGPLSLRDMNGADIGLSVANFNYQEYGERFLPPSILSEMVKQNMLGQKTGCGFYIYDKDTRKKIGLNPRLNEIIARLKTNSSNGQFNVERLFLPMINEAFLALQEKICAPDDLDPALKAGLGMRKGPFELAFELSLPHCLSELEMHFNKYGERFRPAPLLKRYIWGNKTSID